MRASGRVFGRLVQNCFRGLVHLGARIHVQHHALVTRPHSANTLLSKQKSPSAVAKLLHFCPRSRFCSVRCARDILVSLAKHIGFFLESITSCLPLELKVTHNCDGKNIIFHHMFAHDHARGGDTFFLWKSHATLDFCFWLQPWACAVAEETSRSTR